MKTQKESKPVGRTPGKWTWNPEKTFRGAHVAGRTPRVFGGDDGLDRVADVFREADARLIAAAPDLLEALKAMQRAFDNYSAEFNPSGKPKKVCNWGEFNEDMLMVSAAIAKAEGK